jgi:hypothetical protein
MWGPPLKSFAGIVGGPNCFRNMIRKTEKLCMQIKLKDIYNQKDHTCPCERLLELRCQIQ